jgi:hypothetical protein
MGGSSMVGFGSRSAPVVPNAASAVEQSHRRSGDIDRMVAWEWEH